MLPVVKTNAFLNFLPREELFIILRDFKAQVGSREDKDSPQVHPRENLPVQDQIGAILSAPSVADGLGIKEG